MNLVAKLALGARLLADRWNDFLEGTRAHQHSNIRVSKSKSRST